MERAQRKTADAAVIHVAVIHAVAIILTIILIIAAVLEITIITTHSLAELGGYSY